MTYLKGTRCFLSESFVTLHYNISKLKESFLSVYYNKKMNIQQEKAQGVYITEEKEEISQ